MIQVKIFENDIKINRELNAGAGNRLYFNSEFFVLFM